MEKGAVADWFRRFFEWLPEIRLGIQSMCVQNIFDTTGNNLIAVDWTLRLTNRQGRAAENSGLSVVSVKGGKVDAARGLLFDGGDEFRRNLGLEDRFCTCR